MSRAPRACAALDTAHVAPSGHAEDLIRGGDGPSQPRV